MASPSECIISLSSISIITVRFQSWFGEVMNSECVLKFHNNGGFSESICKFFYRRGLSVMLLDMISAAVVFGTLQTLSAEQKHSQCVFEFCVRWLQSSADHFYISFLLLFLFCCLITCNLVNNETTHNPVEIHKQRSLCNRQHSQKIPAMSSQSYEHTYYQ